VKCRIDGSLRQHDISNVIWKRFLVVRMKARNARLGLSLEYRLGRFHSNSGNGTRNDGAMQEVGFAWGGMFSFHYNLVGVW
jgi:hypothetical protein